MEQYLAWQPRGRREYFSALPLGNLDQVDPFAPVVAVDLRKDGTHRKAMKHRKGLTLPLMGKETRPRHDRLNRDPLRVATRTVHVDANALGGRPRALKYVTQRYAGPGTARHQPRTGRQPGTEHVSLRHLSDSREPSPHALSVHSPYSTTGRSGKYVTLSSPARRGDLESRNPAENPPIGEQSCEPDFFEAKPS